MTEERFSYCRGCVAHCGLAFEVDDNRILSHRADAEHVASRGFKCIKADLSVQFIEGQEDRFQTSMRRDETGKLVPIDTATMMDEVAAIIGRTVRDHGRRSVGLYYGTATFRKSFALPMARQFLGAIGEERVFSTMTIDQSAHWVVEGRLGMFATGRPGPETTDLIILVGTNPMISRGGPYQAPMPTVNHAHWLKAYRQRGGKLIVVDPRRTETARFADLHIQPRPGVDCEIFAALIGIVLDHDWHDAAFCERWVGNLDALRAAIAPFTAEMVADRAGLDPAQLHEAARMIGEAHRISAGFGTGLAMSPHPNTAGHMIEALNAICGAYLRAGERQHHAGIFSTKADSEGVIPPHRSWESGPKLSTGFGSLYGEFPTSRLVDEILNPGKTQIRTLIVLGANPMMAFGEPDRLREALEALDCLIVIEPRPTETTEHADYVVSPSLPFEEADISQIISEWGETPYLQYSDPVVAPPPDTIAEWAFFNGIANRLGHVLNFKPFAFGAGSDQAAEWPLTPDRDWTTEDLIGFSLNEIGMTIEDMRGHPHGLRYEKPAVTIASAGADDGARLDVCPPDVAAELAGIAATEPASRRKYRLIVRRITELLNSEFRASPTLGRRFGGGAPVFIHPDDMQEEGLKAGALVEIEGDKGRISGHARADATLRRGTVAMPHCWNGTADSAPASNHTSRLVSMAIADVQPIDGMPQHSSLPVDIRPAA
jgi:anaerobic selenocysteine-containing dehydrogenase